MLYYPKKTNMALIPWKPFWDLEKWFEDWELPEDWSLGRRGWGPLSGLKTPKMDIYEQDNNLIAEVELPGVNPNDIDVEVKDNALKVEAKTEEKKEEKKKGYYRKELSKGYYKRVVPLPVEVDEKKAEAEYKDGVLKVVIPKVVAKKEEKANKIKVKSK